MSKKNQSKRKTKLEKRNITVDEVLIQAAIVMVTTVSDAKREGATVKFQTEVDGVSYDVDIAIKIAEKPLMQKV